MPPSPISPQFFQLHDLASPTLAVSIRSELSQGLLASKATVSPKYLYDKLGSALFDAITELPEYYPTRTEATIFQAQKAAFAQHIPAGSAWVDLGAGSCAKSASLFAATRPAQYIAVDISTDYLRGVLTNLAEQYPQIAMSGVGLDFSASLELPPALLSAAASQPIVGFYPGSSIGNFSPPDALAFLKRIHALCKQGKHGGGVLIGVDLVKPSEILEPAYDDPLGVTGAFNLNMLRNINSLLGSDFDVADWQHVAFFDTQLSRIEMHVQAKRDLVVSWGDAPERKQRSFKRGESIHTENSYKWTVESFADLLMQAGFAQPTSWTDEQGWFSVYWAAAQ
jgi:L-histidine Nalpha-methyltransferase